MVNKTQDFEAPETDPKQRIETLLHHLADLSMRQKELVAEILELANTLGSGDREELVERIDKYAKPEDFETKSAQRALLGVIFQDIGDDDIEAILGE